MKNLGLVVKHLLPIAMIVLSVGQAFAFEPILVSDAVGTDAVCETAIKECVNRATERWERCNRSAMNYGCYSQLKRDGQRCLDAYNDCMGLPRQDLDDLINARD